jgi:cytochrome c peroxidase
MIKRWFPVVVCISLLAIPSFAQARDPLQKEAVRLFGRLPAAPPADTAEVRLGRALFWDASLSANGATSCGSCHAAGAWGSDNVQYSTDALGNPTSRHSQTVFNAMLQPTLRWLGDRASGAEQAEGSLTGSLGFPSKDAAVAQMRASGYGPAFAAAYPWDADPVTAANFGKAVAAYQATLLTPSRFDRFVEGDLKALTRPQRAGLRAFIDAGCATCHNGPLFGGALYRKFGVKREYWTVTSSTRPDSGRFSITKSDKDHAVFRVAMLRNVEKTWPYFHDGSISDLPAAVRIMAEVQLGVSLDDQTVASIVEFLKTLTGSVPANYGPAKTRMADASPDR